MRQYLKESYYEVEYISKECKFKKNKISRPSNMSEDDIIRNYPTRTNDDANFVFSIREICYSERFSN